MGREHGQWVSRKKSEPTYLCNLPSGHGMFSGRRRAQISGVWVGITPQWTSSRYLGYLTYTFTSGPAFETKAAELVFATHNLCDN